MKLVEIISNVVGSIRDSKEKIPLILLAIPILTCAYWTIYWLLFIIAGYMYFLDSLGSFFSALSKICFFLLGIYMILLCLKEKAPIHAVAGAALIFRSLLPFLSVRTYWGPAFVWLACGILLAIPSYLAQEAEDKKLGTQTLVVVAGYFVLSLLLGIIPSSRIGFFTGIHIAALYALFLVELLFILAVVLRSADKVGGIADYVSPAIAKLSGKFSSKQGVTNVLSRISDFSGRFSFDQAKSEIGFSDSGEDDFSSAQNKPEHALESSDVLLNAEGISAHTGGLVGATAAGSRIQYKTVAGPVGLSISKRDSYESGVKQYAAIIDRESVGGWKLDSIYEIPVTKRAGCIASLFGLRDETVFFNMLIFSKEE